MGRDDLAKRITHSVFLRPFAEGDIPALLAWVDSPELLLQWSGQTFSFPLDECQIQVHLELLRREPAGGYAFCGIDRESGKSLGHVELINVNMQHGYATATRVLIGPPAQRGQGLGKQLISELLHFAFERLGLHRVQLHAYESNARALACYERSGFRRDGVLREHTRAGNCYLNSILMSILDREWRELTKR